MMGSKVAFGLLALVLVSVHFADAQAEGKRKCKKKENYRSVGNENCGLRRTPWKTVIENDDYRVDCRCRGGLFRTRECIKCVYGTSTTTVAPTEQPSTRNDATSENPATDPATAVPSTEVPVNPSTEVPVNPSTEVPVNPSTEVPVNPSTEVPVNPSTEVPVIITSEIPFPTIPETEVPSEAPSSF